MTQSLISELPNTEKNYKNSSRRPDIDSQNEQILNISVNLKNKSKLLIPGNFKKGINRFPQIPEELDKMENCDQENQHGFFKIRRIKK